MASNYTLLNLKWKKEKIYSLGTWFYKDYRESLTQTYNTRLEVIESTLKPWLRRNLTLIGKITVIKSMCLSKINFALSSFETPKWFIDQLDDALSNYLWNGKPPRVRKDVMFNNYDSGGLKMTNIKFHIAAQKINWVKHLMNNPESYSYKYISNLINMNLIDFLKCTIDPEQLPNIIPLFY